MTTISVVTTKRSGMAVQIYAHHKSEQDMLNDLANAMRRGKDMWYDGEYMGRIIFCEVVSGQEMSTTGFGISAVKLARTDSDITVDCEAGTIQLLDDPKVSTFEEFITQRTLREVQQ